jgi:hypothetical protein
MRLSQIAQSVIVGTAVTAAFVGSAHASTIVKLNLDGVGADVGMASGVFGTLSDGNVGTTGDQNTAIEYTSFLDSIPDITTDTGSFTMSNLTVAGAPQVIGSVVVQGFSGGTFNLFDPSNTLLLSGSLTNSALTGTIGAPGAGSLFTTTFGNFTGGSLFSQLDASSLTLSMNFTDVNGGSGLSVVSNVLQPFQADSAVNISAEPFVAPEPSSLAIIGATGVLALARRRRRTA